MPLIFRSKPDLRFPVSFPLIVRPVLDRSFGIPNGATRGPEGALIPPGSCAAWGTPGGTVAADHRRRIASLVIVCLPEPSQPLRRPKVKSW